MYTYIPENKNYFEATDTYIRSKHVVHNHVCIPLVMLASEHFLSVPFLPSKQWELSSSMTTWKYLCDECMISLMYIDIIRAGW